MKSYHDGERWRHKLGASWLKTTDLCLERARMEHVGTMPLIESDAACVGTAMHHAVEHCIAAEGLPLEQMLELAQDEFTRLTKLDGTNGDPNARHKEGVFKWIKYTEQQARALVDAFTMMWFNEVWPTLSPGGESEWVFGDTPEDPQVVLVDDDERVIELSGAIDYVDGARLKDWKTSGSGPYKKWEYERWALQPTLYTYARNAVYGYERPEFEYVVMHAKGVQRFTVQRGPEHWDWLATKCEDIARQIELQLPSWIKSDNHALCSERWCPAWAQCKGATGIVF